MYRRHADVIVRAATYGGAMSKKRCYMCGILRTVFGELCWRVDCYWLLESYSLVPLDGIFLEGECHCVYACASYFLPLAEREGGACFSTYFRLGQGGAVFIITGTDAPCGRWRRKE